MKILDGQRGKRCAEGEYLEYTHKRCPKCKTVKAVSSFYKKITQTKRGWAWDSKCIKCRQLECKEYGKNNRVKRNQRLREWRRKNPEKARLNDKRGRIKNKYGITLEQVNILRGYKNNCCWICGEEKKLFIDHNHITGKVRGMLCPRCNNFIGQIEMNSNILINAKSYLDQPCHADVLLEMANKVTP